MKAYEPDFVWVDQQRLTYEWDCLQWKLKNE